MTKREIWHGHEDDAPLENGLYVAKIYWGWKLLQWRDGEWWIEGFVCRWRSEPPTEWIGPLPGSTVADKTVYVEYDL